MNERSVKKMAIMRKRMGDRIPYGPTRQYLTKPEVRKQLQNMDPVQKQTLMQQTGEEQWAKLMGELYN